MVTVQRGNHQVTRNSSLFKRVGLNASHKEKEDPESESEYNPHPQQKSPETPITQHTTHHRHQDVIHNGKGCLQPNSTSL